MKSVAKGKKQQIEDEDDIEDTSEEMLAALMSARDVAVDVLGTRSPEVVRALFVVMPTGDDDPDEFEDFMDDLRRSVDMARDLYGTEYTPLSAVGVYEDVFADLDEG